eukprot:Trichotokara_eunicae@DN3628_c0_g1_i1.p1
MMEKSTQRKATSQKLRVLNEVEKGQLESQAFVEIDSRSKKEDDDERIDDEKLWDDIDKNGADAVKSYTLRLHSSLPKKILDTRRSLNRRARHRLVDRFGKFFFKYAKVGYSRFMRPYVEARGEMFQRAQYEKDFENLKRKNTSG